MTHKKVWICLFLIFSSVFVVGAGPVKAPSTGASIVDLIETIDQNSKDTRVTSKKVEDLEGHIKEEFSSKWGIIVVGVSAVIFGERLILSLFALIGRKRGKKSYEKHIRDMQDEQKFILENTREVSDVLLKRNTELMDRFDKMIVSSESGGSMKKGLFIGFCLGLLFYSVVVVVLL